MKKLVNILMTVMLLITSVGVGFMDVIDEQEMKVIAFSDVSSTYWGNAHQLFII